MSRLRSYLAGPRLAAVTAATRAAIVVPAVLILTKIMLGNEVAELFAPFAAFSVLAFVQFGGPRKAQLVAYIGLAAGGAALIALGTLTSEQPWLAAVSMAVVAFVVLFSGIVNGYIAAASVAALLAFVLGVMVPASALDIPDRMVGWVLGSAVAVFAVMLLWPSRSDHRLRAQIAHACRALAACVEAGRSGDAGSRAARYEAATTSVDELRRVSGAMTYRPTGASRRTTALARLVDEVGWLKPFLLPLPVGATGRVLPEEDAEVRAAVVEGLRASAHRLETGTGDLDLERLERARRVLWEAVFRLARESDAAGTNRPLAAAIDEAFHVRLLSYGTRQIGVQAIVATGGQASDTDDLALVGSRRPDGPRRQVLGVIREVVAGHATVQSVWFRNSVRAALGLGLAVLVGQLAELQHGFWVALGTLSVLRSNAVDTGSTIVRALLGTIVGIVVGGVVLAFMGTNQVVLWTVLPIAVFVAVFAPMRGFFAAAQAAFTVFVLVFFDLLEPIGWRTGLVRVTDIAIGCAISLGVGLLLWPRGAAVAVRRTVATAFSEGADYLAAALNGLFAPVDTDALDAAAHKAIAAGRRLDDAFRQYVAERSSTGRQLESLAVLIAGATRVRWSAHSLRMQGVLWDYVPAAPDGTIPSSLRDRLDSELTEVRSWYQALGDAVVGDLQPPVAPVGRSSPAGPDGTIEIGVHAARWLGPIDQDGHDGPETRLIVAWAGGQLDILRDLQPNLASAARELAAATEPVESGNQSAPH